MYLERNGKTVGEPISDLAKFSMEEMHKPGNYELLEAMDEASLNEMYEC